MCMYCKHFCFEIIAYLINYIKCFLCPFLDVVFVIEDIKIKLLGH